MKKRIVSLIMLLTILFLCGSTIQVKAATVPTIEIDPKSYIDMPSSILNGKGTIRVSSSAGNNYQLYYQKIDISNDVYTRMQNINKNMQEYVSTEQAKLTAERENVMALQNAYTTIRNDSNATEEQVTQAYEAYETATDAYNTHVEAYNEKLEEYKISLEYLMAMCIESDWIEIQGTTDNVNMDFSNYTGEIHFILWAKLVTPEGTFLDRQLYSTNITKTTSITLDKGSATLEVSKTLQLSPTTNSNKTITWTSSKEEVATVDQNGKVTAKAEGTTVITATVDGKSATCTVTVTTAKTDDNGNNNNDNQPNGDTADFSNAKFTYRSKTLRVLEIDINQYKTKKDCNYLLYVSKNKEENIESIPLQGDGVSPISIDKEGVAHATFINEEASKIREYAGTNYMYIIERNTMDDTKTLLVKAKEIPNIELPGLGQRLDIWLFDPSKTAVSNMVGINKDRKINYKIGKITSDDILRAFKNEPSETAFSKLLEYAKKEKAMATGSITESGLDYNLVNKLNIEKDCYYFVYMSADTENGKYNELEDVAIYRECNEEAGNALVHFDFAEIKVEDKKDNTTATGTIPQTGISYVVGIIVISVILVGGMIANQQYKKYKDIK